MARKVQDPLSWVISILQGWRYCWCGGVGCGLQFLGSGERVKNGVAGVTWPRPVFLMVVETMRGVWDHCEVFVERHGGESWNCVGVACGLPAHGVCAGSRYGFKYLFATKYLVFNSQQGLKNILCLVPSLVRYKLSISLCNPHSATVINALGYKADRSFCNQHSSPVHHLAHNAQRNCDQGTSLNWIPSTQDAQMWFFVSQLQVCLSRTSWKESPVRVQILSWSLIITFLKFTPLLRPPVNKWIMDQCTFQLPAFLYWILIVGSAILMSCLAYKISCALGDHILICVNQPKCALSLCPQIYLPLNILHFSIDRGFL